MSNNVVHFAVYADDLVRAQDFYKKVFGWRFASWGPPDFYLITTGSDEDPGIRGALQKRQQPNSGTGTTGYECTIAVDDLDRTVALIEEQGGSLIIPRTVIPGVGWLIMFGDTEGNRAGAMQYDENAT